MIRITKTFATAAIAVCLASTGLFSPAAQAEAKTSFKVAWSIYAGWMPWGYMDDSGIMDKWATKYGIDVEIVQTDDYVKAIGQYTAGAFDGVCATNMETLSIASGRGVDTTALIVGDYSNGNDAVLLKGDGDMSKLAGRPVNLDVLSVSHYLLTRGLDSVGLSERDLGALINTSGPDMVAAFATPDVEVAVTWNPYVSTIMETPGVSNIFDSSEIPGEIIDMMVVNTQTLADNPAFGKALVGAWYETMALMAASTPEGAAARTAMAEASGTDLFGYEAQLETTKMFFTPAEALAFTTNPELSTTMTRVAQFLFDKGILGKRAPSPDFVGVAYANGLVTGNPGNVKLRYDVTYMKMAADGAL